jgi:argininosuccinate lyase
LADTLVRREGLSFREAHALVAETLRACGARDDPTSMAEALRKNRPALQLSREEIESCLDPEGFVRVRNVIGGPAREQTSLALDGAGAEQRRIESWIASTEAALDTARAAVTRNP